MINKILYGREKSLTLPTGEKRTAQYVIVDLDEIKASHNEITYADTIGYPVNEYGRNINDRNYKTDPAAQQTVVSIAKNLDADKLIELTSSPSGTPIINKDGFVVSGNNRIMSLKLAAGKYPEQYENYVKTLLHEITSFGFTAQTAINIRDKHYTFTNGIRKPVLVRIDKDIPILNTTELAKYNLTARKGERPVDQAVKLGNILRENEKCRNVILSIVDGYETFSDLYAAQGRNDRKRLIQAFVDCGLIPEQQTVSYYNEYGDFTDAGKDFVENVLSAMVLSPDALNVAGQEGIRRLRQIIISSLPVLITNENLGPASLRPYISEAVVIEYKARQVGDFADYMRSQQLFEGDQFNEKSFYINRLLNEGRNKFKDAIKKYNDAIKSNTGSSLFGSEQLSPDDIFDRTIVRQVPSADGLLILQKFSKPKKMNEDYTPSGTNTPNLTHIIPERGINPPLEGREANLWTNDAWFKDNPDKILGTPYETSGRFGAVTKYKGSLEDLKKIEAPDNFIGNMKAVTDPLISIDDQRMPELDALAPDMQDKIGQIGQ